MAAVVDTDRVKLQKQQVGVLVPGGLTDPQGTINETHQETFTWEVGSDATIPEIAIAFRKKCKVVKADFTPATSLAANGSSYITQLLQKRDGAGGAPTTVGTIDTNTAGGNVSLSAFIPAAMTISTSAGVATVAAGQLLTFKSTETGTPATPVGKFSVTVQYI